MDEACDSCMDPNRSAAVLGVVGMEGEADVPVVEPPPEASASSTLGNHLDDKHRGVSEYRSTGIATPFRLMLLPTSVAIMTSARLVLAHTSDGPLLRREEDDAEADESARGSGGHGASSAEILPGNTLLLSVGTLTHTCDKGISAVLKAGSTRSALSVASVTITWPPHALLTTRAARLTPGPR